MNMQTSEIVRNMCEEIFSNAEKYVPNGILYEKEYYTSNGMCSVVVNPVTPIPTLISVIHISYLHETYEVMLGDSMVLSGKNINKLIIQSLENINIVVNAILSIVPKRHVDDTIPPNTK